MITTIIPTFRRPDILGRAIESVLAQSYGNLKIAVYDNASGDETEAVVRDYMRRDARVMYRANPTNLGPVRNMIQGVSAVETPYYSLLNDDDFLLPGFYEGAVRKLSANTAAMFACTKTKVIDIANRSVEMRNQDWAAGFYSPDLDVVKKMYSSHFVPTGVLFRRQVRDVLGPFERSGSDSLYLTMAAAALPFLVLDQYGGAVTLHEQAYSMVGEGINKEPIDLLYEHFLSSVSSVMAAPITSEMKSLVLMLIVNSYHQVFDSKRLFYYLNGQNESGIEQLLIFPSLITNRGLVNKFHNSSPACFRPLLRYFYGVFSTYNKKRAMKRQVGCALPEVAAEMLKIKQVDYSELFRTVAQD